jgi:hypothetical protein
VGWPRRCTCTNIFVVAGVSGCREGSGGWMGIRGMSVEMRMQKVWG